MWTVCNYANTLLNNVHFVQQIQVETGIQSGTNKIFQAQSKESVYYSIIVPMK